MDGPTRKGIYEDHGTSDCRDCGHPATIVTSADTLLCDECRSERAADDPGDLHWDEHDVFARIITPEAPDQ